ncbi:MAG: hypothetical protein ACP5XB_32465, partial [Isosphaeraceae bacterium]
MPARTKGRAKFDFKGRPFVWWVDGDYGLRIASADKRFVVAVALGRASDEAPILVVHGQEFPGLPSGVPRPVHLIVPEPRGGSMGVWVEELLMWSFNPSHE